MTKLTKYQQKSESIEISRKDIKNAPYNPRFIKKTNAKRLREGIKRHGMVGGIVWNRTTGNIVGGHRRIEQIDELEGSDDYTLRVEAIEVDENREMELNLLLNNRKAQGEDDIQLLEQVFENLQANDVNFEGAGYTAVDVQQMFPDSFLVGEEAEQHEAESEDIGFFQDVKETSKEVDSEFRERMGEEPKEDQPTCESQDSQSLQDSGDTKADPESEVEPRPEGQEDWQHDKDYFKNRREDSLAKNRDVFDETDILLTLSFQTVKQREAFQQAFNLDFSKRNFDVFDIEEGFGIELPRSQ